MLSIRDISIKSKLVLMKVFTSMLVLGLCFAAFVVTDINGYKERKVNSTVSIAQVIGSSSISAIQFMDNEAARKMLSDLQKVEPDIINASILDGSGKVFARYTKAGKTVYNFSLPARPDEHRFAGDFLYVYKSIINDKELIGTICLQVELSQLEQIINQKFLIATILLIIGIGLAFLIAVLNQKYISKPLLYLVRMMRTMRENNDYSRHVEVKGRDEISWLSSEFNNLMNEVVKSQQKKDEFIGIASHELKTPLTSVKLYLELLEKVEKQEPNKAFVLKARDGVNKLQNLILDLLDVSKIQSGQLQLDIKEFNIDELIDECIQTAQMNTTIHSISREGSPSNQLVSADRHRIEQVIINFLSNATKYSPEGTDILVKSQAVGSDVVVSVKDFGIGMPKAEHDKIFDRFYRAPGKNFGISGFGLGLYICAQIMKRHNGRIWVESEEDKGSTFYFALPVIKE
jgi:signal transduction histidine kinase